MTIITIILITNNDKNNKEGWGTVAEEEKGSAPTKKEWRDAWADARTISDQVGRSQCWNWRMLTYNPTQKFSSLQPCRKFHEDKSAGSPFCRMCNTIGESVTKLISEYTKLVKKESAIMKMWKIGLRRLDRAEKWWEKQPNRKLCYDAKRTGCSQRRLHL